MSAARLVAASITSIAIVLAGDHALAQTEKAWSFSASAYGYFVPEDHDYVLPIFTADRDWLHLEARYNYEDSDTGSAWFGYNFGGTGQVEWTVTPMLGGVFGATTGIAPGVEGSLRWRWLELYSEGEYVFDLGDSNDSYFYNWSELTAAPVEWFRFGLVTQRTRAYQTERDIQRGPMVGFTIGHVDLSAYAFNPDDEQATYVLAVAYDF